MREELFFALDRPPDLLLPPRDFEPPRDFDPPRDFALARPLLRDPPRLDDALEPRLFFALDFFALDLREPPDLRLDFELPPRDFDFAEPVDFFALLALREEPRLDPLPFLLDRPELPPPPDELRPPPPDDLDPPPPPEL